METADAVKLIMGLPTTKLKLKIEREGEKEPIIKELARDTVTVESLYGWKRNPKDDSWDYYIDPKNKIAYMYMSQFARYTDEEMPRPSSSSRRTGSRGWCWTCGSTRAGTWTWWSNICDMFIDDGVIVSIRRATAGRTSGPCAGTRRGAT